VRRRELIVAGGLALLARPASASAQRSDIEVLIKLLAREESAAEAYGAGKGVAVENLYSDELAHVEALRTQLDALGRRPAPRAPDAPARRLLAADGDARLAAAIALETSLVEDYSSALADIADPGVLQTAGTILASHAQHLARMRAVAKLSTGS
jgi:Ferritin-like domain